jgi:hypothetical protein
MIERRRRFCGRNFLLDMLVALISYRLPFELHFVQLYAFALKLWWLVAIKLILRERVVRIAIQPVLARLRGRNDRMCGYARMFAGVLVR